MGIEEKLLSEEKTYASDCGDTVLSQIKIREKLASEMVGNLYRGMVIDELARLRTFYRNMKKKEKSIRFISK